MPNDMEKLLRELSRYTEIVALFKRISDEETIARPDNSTDWERRNRTSSSARPFHAAGAGSR
jgi:predicted N-formylglutamate amidohydrolase